MSMQRRLIGLVGTLVLIVALVAGTLLMALPVYLESRDIKNEEIQVAGANQILVAQIDGLRAKEAEMPRIQQELGKLRSELPHIPQLDDVVTLALRAAAEADGTVEGVSFIDPAEFLPRSTSDVVASLPKTATDVTAEEAGADSPPAGEAPAADAGADAGADQAPSSAAGDLQVSVSITVTVPSTTAAARLLDELRVGPRLLRIDGARGALDAESGEIELTVDGVVFVKSS